MGIDMSSVVDGWLWPRRPATVATSVPFAMSRLALVCRREWTFKAVGRPCFFRISLNRQVKVEGVMGSRSPWRRKM